MQKKNENKTEERVKLQKENETSPTKLLSPEGFFATSESRQKTLHSVGRKHYGQIL